LPPESRRGVAAFFATDFFAAAFLAGGFFTAGIVVI
jgi:hypothetical protein